MSPLTSVLQGRSRLHRSYQASRFRRRASTSAGSLKRCRAGGGAGAAAGAPARRAARGQRTAGDGEGLRSSTAPLPGGRAPSTGLYADLASTGENTPRFPSPPAAGHLRGAMRPSCSAPGAGPRSRRSAGAPRPPPPPGPARGSWRSCSHRRARLPGKIYPAPPSRGGQSERGSPPTAACQPIEGKRAGRTRTRPPPDRMCEGRGLPARWSQSASREQKGPPLLPPVRASAREGPKGAVPAKRLLT